MKKLPLLLTGGLLLAGMASCVNAGELAGNTEGAQVIRVEKTGAVSMRSTISFIAR